jgi:hypothetical protein
MSVQAVCTTNLEVCPQVDLQEQDEQRAVATPGGAC